MLTAGKWFVGLGITSSGSGSGTLFGKVCEKSLIITIASVICDIRGNEINLNNDHILGFIWSIIRTHIELSKLMVDWSKQ